VGQRLYEPDGQSLEIVGVAKTSKYDSLTETPTSVPFVYLPIAQRYSPTLTFHVRTVQGPERDLEALRRALMAIDTRLPVFDVQTMAEHIGVQATPIRAGAALLGTFGVLALALACTGLYGALAYFISQRTSEIGIRMALGASRGAVLRLVLAQGLRPLVWGTLIGVLPCAAFSAFVAIELYDVTPADFTFLAGIIVVQLLVACVACWIPARRAVRLDPAAALRSH
jgi:putative ABC transport system permease protein